MSVLIPGIQCNPASLYSPVVSGSVIQLVSDASGIPTGDTNYPTPANLKPGLYALLVRNTANGIGINSIIYWNGDNFVAGGLAQSNGDALSIYSASPFTQISTANTSGAVIQAGIRMVPLSLGAIPGI